MKRAALYIETSIETDIETLWRFTQTPHLHQEWDLRFSTITYLPKANEASLQQFQYVTNIGLGLRVEGLGESLASRTSGNGECTSVLKFWSDSQMSIIKVGSGYWKYIPHQNGVRFITGFDYTTRWGLFGGLLDKIVFRPFLRYSTALSFDVLKRWIEKGIHPAQAFRAKLTVLIASVALSCIWLYLGIVPKLLYPERGELALLQRSNLFVGYETSMLRFFGVGEILFGLLLLLRQRPWVHLLNILGLIGLAIGASLSDPHIETYPFNPLSLSIGMIALSCIAIMNMKDLAHAGNCTMKQSQ